MSRFPYRCRDCRTRRTLRKRKERYMREPSCACGGDLILDVYRKRKEHARVMCLCDGYWFPHRRGSKWCRHYAGDISNAELAQRGTEIMAGMRNAKIM